MPNTSDLTDSLRDQERLESDETIIDLPEVKDIPGQEHVRPLLFPEMADTTISSSDEEGEGLLDDWDDTDEDSVMDDDLMENDSDVSPLEKQLLSDASQIMPSDDQAALEQAKLDTTDEDGIPLEVENTESGEDLDIPGSEMDDANEAIGEEDEENNSYSMAQK